MYVQCFVFFLIINLKTAQPPNSWAEDHTVKSLQNYFFFSKEKSKKHGIVVENVLHFVTLIILIGKEKALSVTFL